MKLRYISISAALASVVFIAFIAMSGVPEENISVYQHEDEVSAVDTQDDEQSLMILEEEAEPLQDSPYAEESSEEETPPETENIDASANTEEADEREIFTEAPEELLSGQIIGSVSVPAVGLSDMLAVGNSKDEAQKALETSSVIMCYEYMGLPEIALISVVGGHNYMEFNKLKNAKVGDDVALNLDWGVYEYVIYDIKIQSALSSASKGCLVLYTCYPFDQRFHTTENAYFLCKPKATEVE